MGKVLFDASNIFTGGGLQVAASFLDEIGRIADDPHRSGRWPWLTDAVVEASSAVRDNSIYRSSSLTVRTFNGVPRAKLRHRRKRADYDVSFMVFGPDYAARRARTTIVGFADGTSLFTELAHVSGVKARAKHQIRRRVSRMRFKQVDIVVVEAPHVADALVKRWGLSPARMRVVPNVLNSVFLDRVADAASVPLPTTNLPRFCFPTRLHPHKNLTVLGPTALLLKEKYDLDVQFVLTLTDAEWSRLDPATRNASVTVGPLQIAQVPSLYQACNGAIFTSLNESFSITPLEAMASGVPLAASDRPFVRYASDDAAWYFDPLDPASVAEAVAGLLTQPEERQAKCKRGLELAQGWPSATSRAENYLDIVTSAMS